MPLLGSPPASSVGALSTAATLYAIIVFIVEGQAPFITMTSGCIDFGVVDNVVVGPGQRSRICVVPAHKLVGDVGNQGAIPTLVAVE